MPIPNPGADNATCRLAVYDRHAVHPRLFHASPSYPVPSIVAVAPFLTPPAAYLSATPAKGETWVA
jgi:hypothetical protein